MREVMMSQESVHASGRLEWIGLRLSDRTLPMREVLSATIQADQGLEEDRYQSGFGPRHVTLIQLEHLAEIAKSLAYESLSPDRTRRNLAVSGISLSSLIGHEFVIGDCVLFATGDCPPCERMEQTIGPGARKAMEGKGGITARVIQPGVVRVGDAVHRSPRPTASG